MNKNFKFSNMPSVSIQRSKFTRTFQHNNSFNLGELVVLGFDEVIPGSTHRVETGDLVRMSTPIAPIMDDIQFDIYSFFVPCRLTWKNWKYFMGESQAAGVDPTDYSIPKAQIYGSNINTLADDLGIPPLATHEESSGGEDVTVIDNKPFYINVLPLRGFFLIKNRFFRNQNVEAPYIVSDDNSGNVVVDENSRDMFTGLVRYNETYSGNTREKAYKLADYITSCLPYSQKGDPVLIPGTDRDLAVVTGDEHTSSLSDDPLMFRDLTGGSLSGHMGLHLYNGKAGAVAQSNPGTLNQVQPSNLWVVKSSFTHNTINDLRFAFQLQKALERDALYGSRYWETLRAHYSVTAPDATLQDPQLLGHIKFDINISQVLQTTGFSDPTSTSLGTPGANSVTANKGHLFTASFCEHGYIYHIGVARQKRHTYSNALNRVWSRSSRWDFYHPVFANIGAQKVHLKEVFTPQTSEAVSGDDVFGFTDAWNEYRYLPSYNSGYLNPYRKGALDYWTLADRYDTSPTLSQSFLLEDRTALSDALVTGSSGPDFIGSFYFKDTVVNPMPLYSIPGFADHH